VTATNPQTLLNSTLPFFFQADKIILEMMESNTKKSVSAPKLADADTEKKQPNQLLADEKDKVKKEGFAVHSFTC
jgi:hypothetical protein